VTPLLYVLIGITLLGVLAVLFVLLRERIKPQEPDQGALMLQQQLNSLQQRLDAFGQTVTENLQHSTASMNTRLDKAAEVIGNLREKVGQIHEVGKAAQELVNIMRAPKLRGGMGELFLGDLLGQILPQEHYTMPYRFKSGDAVDAVIKIGPRLVCADAKFPYENFKRVVEATAEADRVVARKQFLRDVKKHVDAIATKYILPDEGTYDFALMYIPAENVYYETIIKEDVGEDRQLFSYALAKRVIPVSPNSFYAYVQTILLGLRGMKVEARAQEILAELSRLRGDFEKIQENFRVLGRHLTNASSSYSETEKTMTRLDAKLSQIEEPLVPEESTPSPSLPGLEAGRSEG
jgi:DNA recombination protein RmuC